MKKVTEIPKLPPRDPNAHKGTFGRVLIIAGSKGMTGAAALAGTAALRSGAGLVQVATAESALPVVAGFEPAYTTLPLPEDDSGRISAKATEMLLEALEKMDAAAVGPGLGTSPDLESLVETLILRDNLRLVIDGDGLNNLCQIKNWHEKTKAEIVLTPHPGEFKRLWISLFDRKPMPEDRSESAAALAKHTGTTVVLKGAGTVVTDSEKFYVNNTGNPGMATGGSGDVLTGVITALMGQGMSNFDAAILGVYTHGLAGDIAASQTGQVSMMASDLLPCLCETFKEY